MTTVANIRGFRGRLADAVLIDRTSVYGNPARVQNQVPGADARVYGSRAWALLQFKLYWYAPEQRGLRAMARAELAGKTLLCHCSPLPCHGDTIAGYLNLVCPFLERQAFDTIPCGGAHTWTMPVDADPERGTPCDCKGKRWGIRDLP